MDLTVYLATMLKSLRQGRGWSLSRLAEETGVSKAMLGQIERNESSPTVSTLWKIATGLNVPFSTFISPPEGGTLRAYDPQQQAMVVTPIFPWDEKLHFDLFSINLAPGAISESTPHETGVIEHVIVISGVLDMCIDGQWRTIVAGSGLRFAGDEAHAYRNSTAQTTHFHSLIHYPKEKAAGKPTAKTTTINKPDNPEV
ncbi:Cupin domain-containing protein [Kosakonia arachidis]|uniref:Cupin domain-containing protein n=1 Tax=Kosakonia arachidis TaxID=551989 RepID=A0A1I6ZZK3_9ENTR|nr:XRE family transcriptional regulator [Kosakonia arachidis]SFT68116.1 Cupin domain-containing protein [Kosakonia arachidis]